MHLVVKQLSSSCGFFRDRIQILAARDHVAQSLFTLRQQRDQFSVTCAKQ